MLFQLHRLYSVICDNDYERSEDKDLAGELKLLFQHLCGGTEDKHRNSGMPTAGPRNEHGTL